MFESLKWPHIFTVNGEIIQLQESTKESGIFQKKFLLYFHTWVHCDTNAANCLFGTIDFELEEHGPELEEHGPEHERPDEFETSKSRYERAQEGYDSRGSRRHRKTP